jgi:hypothetical protein
MQAIMIRIYESRAPERSAAHVISAPQRGRLAKDMQFALVEPCAFIQG